jgi:ABC-type sugar transport system ATPase subunit
MFGQPVEIRSPRQAIRLGLGLVPEDRKRQGLILSLSGVHNMSLPILRRLARLTWVRQDKERALANEYFDRLRVRATGREGPVASLSGGNQQKIVLARWLAARCRVLILDEPTRGVDVGAKAEIHGLIDEFAAGGAAVLLISSELPEIIGLSSRMLVVRDGRIVGELGHAEAKQERLLRMMAGLESSAPDPDRRDPEHARTA